MCDANICSSDHTEWIFQISMGCLINLVSVQCFYSPLRRPTMYNHSTSNFIDQILEGSKKNPEIQNLARCGCRKYLRCRLFSFSLAFIKPYRVYASEFPKTAYRIVLCYPLSAMVILLALCGVGFSSFLGEMWDVDGCGYSVTTRPGEADCREKCWFAISSIGMWHHMERGGWLCRTGHQNQLRW